MKKIQNTLLGAAIALVSLQSVAGPLSGYDARSLAMGGTGTASGAIGNASYYNPALLAAHREGEDFGFAITGGAILHDENDMIGAIETLQETTPTAEFSNSGIIRDMDRFDQFSNAVDVYNDAVSKVTFTTPTEPEQIAELRAQTVSESGALTTTAQSLVDSLGDLNDKPLEVGAVFGVNFAIPSQYLGIAAFAGGRGVFSGAVSNSSNDLAKVTSTVQAVTGATTLAELQTTIADPFAGTPLETTIDISTGIVTEAGLSLATKIAGIAIGVTSKTVDVEVYEESSLIDSANTDTSNTDQKFSDSNMDIGVAFDVGSFKIGMVGKNLVSQEYKLDSGRKVVIEPQYRAGFSLDSGLFTLTMDQDITENKPVISGGSEKATQYTSIGAEFDIALVQLRVGYRANNADSSGDSDVLTAGIGVHFLVNVDVGVAANDTGVDALITAGIKW